ncbi:MAG: hypothetical protein H0V47_13705 [Chloroflexia bacterium]|jgi:hypothetical protein|nr:hypothetical protein [Chloroflexia bacterium]
MAIVAGIYYDDGLVAVDVYPGVPKAGVMSFPDERSWPFDFNYDDWKLADGEREFLGIVVLDVSLITDYWLAELDKVDLPRVNVPESGLFDVTIADVLRWARQTYPSRYSSATA